VRKGEDLVPFLGEKGIDIGFWICIWPQTLITSLENCLQHYIGVLRILLPAPGPPGRLPSMFNGNPKLAHILSHPFCTPQPILVTVSRLSSSHREYAAPRWPGYWYIYLRDDAQRCVIFARLSLNPSAGRGPASSRAPLKTLRVSRARFRSHTQKTFGLLKTPTVPVVASRDAIPGQRPHFRFWSSMRQIVVPLR